MGLNKINLDTINEQINDLEMKLNELISKNSKKYDTFHSFRIIELRKEIKSLKKIVEDSEIKEESDLDYTTIDQTVIENNLTLDINKSFSKLITQMMLKKTPFHVEQLIGLKEKLIEMDKLANNENLSQANLIYNFIDLNYTVFDLLIVDIFKTIYQELTTSDNVGLFYRNLCYYKLNTFMSYEERKTLKLIRNILTISRHVNDKVGKSQEYMNDYCNYFAKNSWNDLYLDTVKIILTFVDKLTEFIVINYQDIVV